MFIRWYGPTLVLLATIVGALLLGPSLARRIAWTHTDARITQVRDKLLDDVSLATLSNAFSDVSRVVEPSVVHVQVFGETARGSGGVFQRFDPLRPVGSGSGWVYRHTPRDGSQPADYILTNAHVVALAQRIRVRFADGSEHTAALVNADPLTDVAVLSVGDALLHPAHLSPEPVRKGQIVFAFGSPLRFEFSVSQGIVSANGRKLDITNSGKYENFIQTDAAINPGNSGGPLTDIYGRVVGMNTAIARDPSPGMGGGGEGFMGLGFAIPVQMVADIADKIIEEGQVRRGYLGVYIDDLSPTMAQTFGYSGPGVLLEHPVGQGPAARAGLKPGDILTHVQGQAVPDVGALRYRVAAFPPGSSVELTVVRDGEPRSIWVTLSELPDVEPRMTAMPRFDLAPLRTAADETLRHMGIELVADFDEADARSVGFAPLSAVLVLDSRPGSVADAQRLGRGHLITHVGNTPITNIDSLRRAIADHDQDRPLRLTTVRWDPDAREYITRYALIEFPR